ncbi:MAG: hypothetical protein HQ530_02955 [Parcubacteria group bacterium]|nr:hypothetical protein [Parcubacteria group bacterium]
MDNTPIKPKINKDYEGTPSGIKTGFCVSCIVLVFFMITLIVGYFVITDSSDNSSSSFDIQKWLESSQSDDQSDSSTQPEEKEPQKSGPKKY